MLMVGFIVIPYQPLSGIWFVILWLFFSLFLLEVITRVFLVIGIGGHYRYVLFNYILVNHDYYGFRFRESVSSADINFPVVDRVLFPASTTPSRELGANRNQRLRFTTNKLGYRGSGFSRKPSVSRIFCLGGSTTACTYCSDDQAWPGRLQEELARLGFETEVINAGTIGWNSYQNRLLLEQEILEFQPAIVLSHDGWNEEFSFSSLSGRKHWKPNLIRNVRESYDLNIKANSFLSSTRSISFALAIQYWYRELVFAQKMSFENPNRWQMLKSPEYLRAWFDNMIEMAKISSENNIQFFSLDYPGLTNLWDLPQDRAIYVKNTRLTAAYADYQAISKKRISQVLELTGGLVDNLNVDEDFNQFHGNDRLDLFEDEIHLSANGNAYFARALATKLVAAKILKKVGDKSLAHNARLCQRINIHEFRDKIGINPNYMDRQINNYLFSLRADCRNYFYFKKSTKTASIPQSRYTNW